MQNVFIWAARYRLFVVIGLALVSMFFASYVNRVRILATAEGMMAENDPEKDYYDKVSSIFGSDDITIVQVKDKKLFTYEKLVKLREMVEELQDMTITEAEARGEVKSVEAAGDVKDDNIGTDTKEAENANAEEDPFAAMTGEGSSDAKSDSGDVDDLFGEMSDSGGSKKSSDGNADDLFGAMDGSADSSTDVFSSTEGPSDMAGKIKLVGKVESLFNTKNFRGEGGTLSYEAFLEQIPDDKKGIYKVIHDAVDNPLVNTNLISRERDAVAINLYLSETAKKKIEDLDGIFTTKVKNILKKYNGDFEDCYQIGMPYVRASLTKTLVGDMGTLTPLSVTVLMITLIICVRTLNGAIIPMITSSMSLLWTMGFMGLMDIPINVLTAIIPALVIVIGSTEDIHIITEFYEGMHEEKNDRKKAVAFLASKVGIALFLTFVTTFSGFFSIYFNNIQILKQFGLASSFALLANFIITITVNPVFLSLFGKGRTNAHEENADEQSEPTTFFDKLADFFIGIVKNHKKTVGGACALIAFFMALGIGRIMVNNDMVAYFKEDSPIKISANKTSKYFSGMKTFYVVLDAEMEGAFKKSVYLKQVRRVQQYLELQQNKDGTKAFDNSFGVSNFICIINREMHREEGVSEKKIRSYYRIPESDELCAQYYLFFTRDDVEKYVNANHSMAAILVRHNIKGTHNPNLRMKALQRFLDEDLNGIKAKVTGANILINKAADSIATGQAISLFMLIGVIFILMSVLFVNIKAGFLSLIPNLFPIIILFGLMGYLGIWLDTATSMIAAIAIGIAMDDTIHYMVRFQKEMKSTNNQNAAMETTSRAEIIPVLSTSIAIALGFTVLVFSSFDPIIKFGMLTAIIMGVAFLTDVLITPLILISTRLVTLWDMIALDVNAEVLETSPLFRNMRKWEVKKIILLGNVCEYNAGELVIRQGDIGREMFIVLDGSVRVEKTKSSGNTNMLTRIKPGDVFGEVGLVSNIERTASIVTNEPTKTLRISNDDLQRYLKFLPTISSKLFLNIANILGKRFANED